MFKEMCWLHLMDSSGEKVLHLRTAPNQPWRPYTVFPEFAVSDYRISEGSKGWTTYQKLIREGWNLTASKQVQQFLEQPLKSA